MGCGCSQKRKAAQAAPAKPGTSRVLVGLRPWLGMYWVGYPKPLRWWRWLLGDRRAEWSGCGCIYRLAVLGEAAGDFAAWLWRKVKALPGVFVVGDFVRVPHPPVGSYRERVRVYTGSLNIANPIPAKHEADPAPTTAVPL